MHDLDAEPLNLPPITRRARLGLLFGQWAQMPWALAASMLLLAVLLVPATDERYTAFDRPTATVPGEITDVTEVRRKVYSRWGTSSRTAYVHSYRYEVRLRSYTGSYEGWHRLGDDINVEYVIGRPRKCRIAGVESGVPLLLFLLAALATFGFGLGVTAIRWRRLPRLAWRIHDDLSRPPPYRGFGKFPVIRLDRSGKLVAWGTGWLMAWPMTATITAAILLDYLLF